jgi:porin
LTLYFHTGLVYKGFIPTRDNDQVMAALGFGQYIDYRIQINKWAFFQPHLQYVVHPNGTGAIENATILGFETGIAFF